MTFSLQHYAEKGKVSLVAQFSTGGGVVNCIDMVFPILRGNRHERSTKLSEHKDISHNKEHR